MLTFKKYITESSEKSSQDSLGKVHETLVGRALNNGKFSEHHRTEEGSPEEVHNKHAIALYGENYKSHPAYNNAVKNAEKAASAIKEHIKKHGITSIKRVSWTSQPSDHKKETGVHDPNSTADVIVTGHNGKQVGVSLKTGKTKTPNYKNPGIESFEKMSGASLRHHSESHSKILEKHGNPSHQEYKALRDSSNSQDKSKAAEIKKSSDMLNKNVAADIHKGLSGKSHKELHDMISNSVAPKTHLPTVVSHTVTGDNNTHISHHVHDHESHVSNYLSNFEGLHTKPHTGGTSVTVYGTHKKTGKVMPVWKTTVYAGGRPANKSPRGAITLPSESKV